MNIAADQKMNKVINNYIGLCSSILILTKEGWIEMKQNFPTRNYISLFLLIWLQYYKLQQYRRLNLGKGLLIMILLKELSIDYDKIK